jgi:hypothetical protein
MRERRTSEELRPRAVRLALGTLAEEAVHFLLRKGL